MFASSERFTSRLLSRRVSRRDSRCDELRDHTRSHAPSSRLVSSRLVTCTKVLTPARAWSELKSQTGCRLRFAQLPSKSELLLCLITTNSSRSSNHRPRACILRILRFAPSVRNISNEDQDRDRWQRHVWWRREGWPLMCGSITAERPVDVRLQLRDGSERRVQVEYLGVAPGPAPRLADRLGRRPGDRDRHQHRPAAAPHHGDRPRSRGGDAVTDAIMTTATGPQIADLSRRIDHSYPPGLDSEAALWRRVAKIGEEHGEVIAALIGMLGENPRKGITHSRDDLIKELLDVALCALCATEHVTGNQGISQLLLTAHIQEVSSRAWKVTTDEQ